ncbi:IS1239%2C transposase [Streptococcus pneumoniae]|uniref:DegV family protein n=1 Tax=Streptococcus pneumoniae TaxID=1313 RepID=UPI0005DED1B7|nr:IS1239%2C transposase [Streptococcus pneumoniae]
MTIDSRRLIERWKKEGKSNREIASLLGKAPQTIHTEIKRGTVRQCLGKGRFKEVYSADYAQQSYENNRKRSVKKSSLTSLSERAVAEIGISYSGSDDWAKEMKESLQAYVEKPISVLETGSIIQTHTGENAWAILIRYHS